MNTTNNVEKKGLIMNNKEIGHVMELVNAEVYKLASSSNPVHNTEDYKDYISELRVIYEKLRRAEWIGERA